MKVNLIMEKNYKSIKCIGFDNDKYAKAQEKAILKRIKKFKGKLYLEFGGKLFDDYHFARCVPGFNPRVKLKILKRIKNKLEVIICVSAEAIEKGKIRGDYGITYETNILKIIDELDKENIEICAVVITKYDMYPSAKRLKDKLKR